MTTSPATAADDARALRHRLADRLVATGHIRTPAVERAFRTVPRHVFAPEVPAQKAYADDVIATRHAPDGRVTSSVSAPWLQADMLEAARIRPGDRVLEIGSGGYNAALIAELVGPAGHVTTLDIDPAVTDRATYSLNRTGHGSVRVVTGDAEHLPPEVVPDDGFDAVVVTVGTWDLPWIGALAEGGRLVAPLRLHQYTWAVGFTRDAGTLHSNEPLIVCGFVPMRGAGAWTTHQSTIPGTGVQLAWEDGTPLPVDRLASVFTREPHVARTHVTVGGEEPFDALTLYLAGALPGFCRLSVDHDHDHDHDHAGSVLEPPPPHWPGAALVRGSSLARLTTERIAEGEDGNGVYELVVQGHGPTGHLAAREMAEQIQRWQRNHRAALCPRITVRPVTVRPVNGSEATTAAPHVFRKRHTEITIDWPVVPGTAALLTDDEGRYLLHLRSANKPIWQPGRWALPGGNTERGEHPDEAIVRELAEETELRVPGLTVFATLDTHDADGTFKDRVRIYHGILNRPAHEIPLHEGIQLRWTHLHETIEMAMDPGTLAVLRAHHDMRGTTTVEGGTPPTTTVEGGTPRVLVVQEPHERSRSIVGAHLVLLREGTVLLGKRHPGSAFAPSTWHLPAGHREDHESALACAIREAAEETGLTITEGDLTLSHTLDLLDPGSPVPRIQLFFTAARWEGEPAVLEPDRCTDWRWWPLTALPDPIVDYARAALEAVTRGTSYSATGWS